MQSDSINNAINQLSLLPPINNLELCAKQIAELIKANIDCYFVGIYLLNEQKDALCFCAGSGVEGDVFAQNSWRLPVNHSWVNDTILIGDISLINWKNQEKSRYEIYETPSATRKLQPRMIESIFLPARLLPHTEWQLFLPLQNQDGVFGTLELQNSQVHGFETSDFLLFQELTHRMGTKLDINRDG